MSILPDSKYEKIYTGSSIKATYLKTLLEEEGINPILRDDDLSARTSGFGMNYESGVKILVRKENLIKAKHIISNSLDKNGDVIAVSEEDLENQALEAEVHTSEQPVQRPTYKRSPFNVLLNILLIVYSLYRLSPLMRGEELSTLRIILSSVILLVCSWSVINHFRK